MPIYEFDCAGCGARFERLVAAGTASEACPECGEPSRRVLSVQAPPSRLVGTPAQRRRQEARNAGLRREAKRRFKGEMAQRRAARRRSGGSP